MHHHADANLDDILWKRRRWNGSTAYAESKLHDAMLAFAVRAALAGRAVECAGARLGADQDGRPRRARRHGPGASHTSLARGRRRSKGARRRVGYFYHLKRMAAEPASRGPGVAGSPHRDLRRDLRRGAAVVSRRPIVQRGRMVGRRARGDRVPKGPLKSVPRSKSDTTCTRQVHLFLLLKGEM